VTCQDTGIAVVYNKQDEAEFAHNVLKEYGYKAIIEEEIL
jgi:tartrate dehydratase alpha subunit/fumarate hydratase class I-like protein